MLELFATCGFLKACCFIFEPHIGSHRRWPNPLRAVHQSVTPPLALAIFWGFSLIVLQFSVFKTSSEFLSWIWKKSTESSLSISHPSTCFALAIFWGFSLIVLHFQVLQHLKTSSELLSCIYLHVFTLMSLNGFLQFYGPTQFKFYLGF